MCKVIFFICCRSREQQHYFNTPYQLSSHGARSTSDNSSQTQQFLSDSPENAECKSFDVQEGDLILLATDGLFDNLSDEAIEKEIQNLTVVGCIMHVYTVHTIFCGGSIG